MAWVLQTWDSSVLTSQEGRTQIGQQLDVSFGPNRKPGERQKEIAFRGTWTGLPDSDLNQPWHSACLFSPPPSYENTHGGRKHCCFSISRILDSGRKFCSEQKSRRHMRGDFRILLLSTSCLKDTGSLNQRRETSSYYKDIDSEAI